MKRRAMVEEPPFDVDEKEEETVETTPLPDSTEKGRITEVTYKTNKNMGNSEHKSVELTSTVGETEDIEEVFKYLQDTALYLLDNE